MGGLYEKYEFPHMYTSPELQAAQTKLIKHAKMNGKLLGLFLFGADKIGGFLDKGFTMVSVGNDLHHVLTAADGHMDKIETEKCPSWRHRESGMVASKN